MLQAIFGLAGVIVGGLITAGFQLFSRRQERKRAQRVAARILQDELVWWHSILSWAIEQDDASALEPPGAVLAAWEAHRLALVDLSSDEWHRLHLAVRASGAGGAEGLPSVSLGDELVKELREQMGRLDAAARILHEYV